MAAAKSAARRLQEVACASEDDGVMPGHQGFPAATFLAAESNIRIAPDDQGRHVGERFQTVFEVGENVRAAVMSLEKPRSVAPLRGG